MRGARIGAVPVPVRATAVTGRWSEMIIEGVAEPSEVSSRRRFCASQSLEPGEVDAAMPVVIGPRLSLCREDGGIEPATWACV